LKLTTKKLYIPRTRFHTVVSGFSCCTKYLVETREKNAVGIILRKKKVLLRIVDLKRVLL